MSQYPWDNTTQNIAAENDSRYETPGGAQAKADKAEQDAKDYTDAKLNSPELPIPNGSIVERHIRDENVSSRTLAQKAVQRRHIETGAVGWQELDPALVADIDDVIINANFERIDEQLAESEINVKYPPSPLVGVKMDGITNDTVAFGLIMNKAKELNAKLYLPGGTIVLSGTLNNSVLSRMIVKGAGAENTTIRFVGDNPLFDMKGVREFTITDLTIVVDDTNTYPVFDGRSNSTNVIQNNRIERIKMFRQTKDGVGLYSGIVLESINIDGGVVYNFIANVEVNYCKDGILLGAIKPVGGGIGAWATSNRIVDCKVISAFSRGAGVYLTHPVGNNGWTQVSTNVFDNIIVQDAVYISGTTRYGLLIDGQVNTFKSPMVWADGTEDSFFGISIKNTNNSIFGNTIQGGYIEGQVFGRELLRENDISCFIHERISYTGSLTYQEQYKNAASNYIWNGDFSQGLAWWTTSGTPTTTEIVNDSLSPTGRAYKLTKTAASEFSIRQDVLNKDSYVGKRLMATAWVRTNQASGQDIEIYSSKDVNYASNFKKIYNNRYMRISIPFTVDSTVNLRVAVRVLSPYVANLELYVAAIVLTEGNTFNIADLPVNPLGKIGAYGSSSILPNSTGVVCTHNLGFYVRGDNIRVTLKNNMGAATKWWVSNIQQNSFDLHTNVAPDPGGTITADFDWCIEI
jgi:hypothetical protein